MEKILGQSPAMNSQDENLNLKSDVHDAAAVSSVTNEASEVKNEVRSKENLIVGDIQDSKNCESPVPSKESTEKVSPTLLESAFKIMKTLFSPEKPKDITPNSVNQFKNISESPSSSVHSPNKQKLIFSEPNIENPGVKTSFSEEHDLKDKKQLTISMLNPLTCDLHSNDDDSFLTTISYDESFQSAVTHFDECNGEKIKNGDNLSNSIFNNSQDFDLVDSCNSSFENSGCCLENTMLRNDSSSKKNVGDSIKISNGKIEGFSGVKNSDLNNFKLPNADCSYQSFAVQNEDFKVNHLNISAKGNNKLIRNESDSVVEFSSANGDLNESEFHDSCSTIGEIALNDNNQISEQNKVTTPQSAQHLSSIADLVKTKNMKTDEETEFSAEGAILQNSPSSTVHLTKSDLNKVDEMLLALKNDSEPIASYKSLNGNNVILNESRNVDFTQNSDFLYMGQMSEKTEDKPERPVSPNNNRSEKCNGLLNECLQGSFILAKPQEYAVFPLLIQNKQTEMRTESQLENQIELKMGSIVSTNMRNGKVTFKDTKNKQFTKRFTCPVTLPQKNYTVLSINKELQRPIAHSSLCLSENVSVDVIPSNATHPEVVENDDSERKFSVGETVCNISLKHSTPASVLRTNSFFCPSTQKLEQNSLEINEGCDDDKKHKLHRVRSDFLGRAMGIFWSEEPSNILAENPDQKESDSVVAESFGRGSWTKPNDFSETSTLKRELNTTGKPTGFLKENLRSSPSRMLNATCETKPVYATQKEAFEKTLDQTLNEKSDRSKTEFSTFSQNNTSEVSTVGNLTYDMVPENQESDKLNLTCNKIKTGTKTERNTLIELNCTYVKESNSGKNSGSDVKDVNKITEKSHTSGFINDKERSGHSDFQEIDNFLSPIKEPPESIRQASFISVNDCLTENIENLNFDGIHYKDGNHSFLSGIGSASPTSRNSSVVKNESLASSGHIVEDLSGKSKEIDPNELLSELRESPNERIVPGSGEPNVENYGTALHSELANISKTMEPDLAKLIEEQFTQTDIAKICDVANMSENINSQFVKPKENETGMKAESVLSPKSFDFLNSIQGKPTGRDLSRESLYVKFDPLVQPPTANSLIDFTKEVEALTALGTPPPDHSSSICEELLAISPEKKADVIVPPLTPLSDRNKKDKFERQRELQNEIYFLKNLYSERERLNKAKMEEYESQIAKLTVDNCVLEDKFKEYGEREKSIVKKLSAQTHDIEQLKIVMKEYIKVISMLTTELETMRRENAKQIEALTAEKDSYMNHLHNTEAAFSDVHTKYEKSKKTIENLKMNEVMYRTTISEHAQKMEEFKKKAKEAQEKAISEFQNIMTVLHESKNNHSQEVSRLRAQLKKTELKLEAVQESLDQKIKENQQLTAICDELIEGKK